MEHAARAAPRALVIGLVVLVFALTLTARVWDVSTRFWMLGDQIRDWSIALRPFSGLPLVGPPTHVGGYTIGPAFYWILWAIRVTVGPFFDNLPHAGGIGQAILQSAADALLLVAVWHRTRSPWIALATVVLVATASYDLSLSAVVWNPIVGSTLAKVATALILLDWPGGSALRSGVTAAVAWSAVHAYTGAIFVACGVFAALLAGAATRSRRSLAAIAAACAVAVVLLQIPYLVYQVSHGFGDQAMGAVSDSVGRVLSGEAPPRLLASVAGYTGAVAFIQVAPWRVAFLGWFLLGCAAIVAIRFRRDAELLSVVLLPQALAIAGYSFFLAALDDYYYFSLMPAAVLTVVLALTAMPWPSLRQAAAVVLLAGALALVPSRLRHATTMHRMPEYGVLVDASKRISRRHQPMRAIRTRFDLPPTANPEFLYTILGGVIDRHSPWVGIINADGRIDYQLVPGS
jgi:hypothetical protein